MKKTAVLILAALFMLVACAKPTEAPTPTRFPPLPTPTMYAPQLLTPVVKENTGIVVIELLVNGSFDSAGTSTEIERVEFDFQHDGRFELSGILVHPRYKNEMEWPWVAAREQSVRVRVKFADGVELTSASRTITVVKDEKVQVTFEINVINRVVQPLD